MYLHIFFISIFFEKKKIKVFYMMEKNVNFWSNFYHHHAILKPSPSSFLSLYRSTIVQWFKENSKLLLIFQPIIAQVWSLN